MSEQNKALYADGFDAAIIGVGQQFNTELVVYDWDKCVDILTKEQGMSVLDAVEWMDFNVTGAWVGPNTPVFVKVGKKRFKSF